MLTGSSNVLTLPKLSESLAGRMEVVPLWPLAQSEVAGTEPFFLDDLLMGELPSDAEADGLWERVCAGGFPEPLGRASHDRREAWFSSYVTTVTERDVRDLADIEGLTAMPRLLRTLARHAGEPMNVSRLSRETGVPHTTLTRYVSLLESVFLLRPLPSWKSGAKAAKLQFADPGVLTHLLGTSPEMLPQDEVAAQRSLECFVAAEVLRQCDARAARARVQHFRSVRTWSVPVVVVAPDQRAVGIALSLDRSPGAEAFRGLEVLAEIAGADFAQGIVLHAREEKRRVTEKLCMAPVSCLWG